MIKYPRGPEHCQNTGLGYVLAACFMISQDSDFRLKLIRFQNLYIMEVVVWPCSCTYNSIGQTNAILSLAML